MPHLKKTFASLIFMTLCAAGATAQQPDVAVRERLNADNSLTLSAEVTGYGKFTVDINYAKLDNTLSDARVRAVIDRDTKDFIRLVPADLTIPVTAEYTYDWLHGAIDSGADTKFVYRLPFAQGLSSAPRQSVSRRPLSREIAGYTVWEFPFTESVPVYAVRRGLVIKTVSGDNIVGNNSVTVEHADGSIAGYSGLAPGSLRVKEGDTVTPGTVIAETGPAGDGYAVAVGIYYYISNSDPLFGGIAKKQYFNPVFSTKNGNTVMENGRQATAAADKKLLRKEEPKKSLWQRLFGRK